MHHFDLVFVQTNYLDLVCAQMYLRLLSSHPSIMFWIEREGNFFMDLPFDKSQYCYRMSPTQNLDANNLKMKNNAPTNKNHTFVDFSHSIIILLRRLIEKINLIRLMGKMYMFMNITLLIKSSHLIYIIEFDLNELKYIIIILKI